MTKFAQEDIEEVFAEQEIKFPIEDFINALKANAKRRKQKEKEIEDSKPNFVEIYSPAIIQDLEDDETPEEAIENSVENDDHAYSDLFYDEKGMDDEGDNAIVYFKVLDKFYEVEIHCEADWVGDWSVRKNLPGDVSIVSIEELKTFKVQEDTEDYISLEIPKK